MEDLDRLYIPHLRQQFERGRLVLFTGAGFSMAAKNAVGDFLPSAARLKELLWPHCFPGEPFDADTTLQDLFEYAHRRNRSAVADLLSRIFSVNAESLPAWYGKIFSLPWQAVYTLNIDDLESAASRKFNFPRRIKPTSVAKASVGSYARGSDLEVMHLNGALDEVPDAITFSVSQYAQRLASPDPIYRRLTAELVSSPFVFIGSALDEPPLWQSVESRRMKGGREQRELRPRSYLVNPSLPAAKRALLAEFNVVWLPMTAEEFTERVLSQMGESATQGLKLLLSGNSAVGDRRPVPDVSAIATDPNRGSEYLLGSQPIWADVQSGRAIFRENDHSIWRAVEDAWQRDGIKGLIVISGTNGSGKSTALMRVALKLSAEGAAVGWVDPADGLTPFDIRESLRSNREPFVLAIDDADLYGAQLTPLIRESAVGDVPALVIVAIRSGRVDRAIVAHLIEGIPHVEMTIPLLEDQDVDRLIEVLQRENRAGRLKGLSKDKQREIFREQSGRELLVAMIQATSGKKFEDKAVEEMTGLPIEAARIYGLVAVATSFRFGLNSQEILLALGDETNSSLNALEILLKRHLLRRVGDGSVYTRHRVIAEVIRKALQLNGQLSGIVEGLAIVAASQSHRDFRQSARARRILISVINHDFLNRSLGEAATRNLYGTLEQILSWNHHYWLQRGSFEVEFGDLSLAENFLSQARSIVQDDPLVDTEWAYLRFSQANANPGSEMAVEAVEEATAILEHQMARLDRRDPYAFHVMGSQGLAWSRRAVPSAIDRERYLRKLISHLDMGLSRFRGNKDLSILYDDVRREYLGLAVQLQRPLFP